MEGAEIKGLWSELQNTSRIFKTLLVGIKALLKAQIDKNLVFLIFLVGLGGSAIKGLCSKLHNTSRNFEKLLVGIRALL